MTWIQRRLWGLKLHSFSHDFSCPNLKQKHCRRRAPQIQRADPESNVTNFTPTIKTFLQTVLQSLSFTV